MEYKKILLRGRRGGHGANNTLWTQAFGDLGRTYRVLCRVRDRTTPSCEIPFDLISILLRALTPVTRAAWEEFAQPPARQDSNNKVLIFFKSVIELVLHYVVTLPRRSFVVTCHDTLPFPPPCIMNAHVPSALSSTSRATCKLGIAAPIYGTVHAREKP